MRYKQKTFANGTKVLFRIRKGEFLDRPATIIEKKDIAGWTTAYLSHEPAYANAYFAECGDEWIPKTFSRFSLLELP